MALNRYFGSIASAHQKSKSDFKRKKSKKTEDVFKENKLKKSDKEQSLEWSEQGLCYNCGEPSGAEIGICDECRWS